VTNLPAGHECADCGARVESLTVDWADDDGRRVVAEETPMFCPACASSNAGRRIRYEGTDGQIEISVEGVFGVRRVRLSTSENRPRQ
jgi:hypothetical protein